MICTINNVKGSEKWQIYCFSFRLKGFFSYTGFESGGGALFLSLNIGASIKISTVNKSARSAKKICAMREKKSRTGFWAQRILILILVDYHLGYK